MSDTNTTVTSVANRVLSIIDALAGFAGIISPEFLVLGFTFKELLAIGRAIIAAAPELEGAVESALNAINGGPRPSDEEVAAIMAAYGKPDDELAVVADAKEAVAGG